MSNTCNKTISNYSYKSKGWEGRGFGRRFIAVYQCECGSERRMRINSFRGSTPSIAPGAFVCGGIIENSATSPREKAETDRSLFIENWCQSNGVSPMQTDNFDRAAMEWAKANCFSEK